MKKPPSLPRAQRTARKPAARPAVEVIEEATSLLRRLPARAWLWFHATSIPLVLALVWFWSEMTRAPDASLRVVPASLLLAVLYILMKCGHAVFGDILLSMLRRDPERPRRLSSLQWLRLAGFQAMTHATMPWVLFLCSLPVFPLAWAYAFYRNTSLLACGHLREHGRFTGLFGRCLRVAHHAPRANHALLLILPLVALLLWINAIALALFIPQLTGILTGIELAMNSSQEAMLNTTLMAASMAVAWLVISPMFHAVYAVRCFEADSVKSGEDLLAGLRSLRLPAVVPVIALALTLGTALSPRAAAADAATPDIERAVALDQALDETLDQAEFRWRMPRGAKPESEMGWFERTIYDISQWLASTVKTVTTWIGDFLRWLFENDTPNDPSSDNDRSWLADPANARALLVVLLVLLVVILAILAVRWFAARRAVPSVETPPLPTVDLSDESVLASDLPEDEWLRLANEQLAAGDARLALRALFLGTLSRLGSIGLLAIAPGKTNGMYLRELGRRSQAGPAIRSAFDQSVRLFERCWYGEHIPDSLTVEQVRHHHDTISQNAPSPSP